MGSGSSLGAEIVTEKKCVPNPNGETVEAAAHTDMSLPDNGVREWTVYVAEMSNKRLDPASACGPAAERTSYDKCMRSMLLRNSTPSSVLLSMEAVAKFAKRAKSAKLAVSRRRAEEGLSNKTCDAPTEPANDRVVLVREKSREEKIAVGLKLIAERLAFLKLQMMEMVDDGNCQFRAFSQELFGTQSYHQQVRGQVVSYLRDNADSFSFYVGEAAQWDEYLTGMEADGAWGDELTLTAAARVFNVNIHIVTTESENWLLRYDGSADGEVNESAKRDLFLVYISPIHYNVLSAPHPR